MVEISTGILERYAADVAREIGGVRSVSKVKVASENGAVRVELRVAVAWGASIPALGRDVQTRVREYLLHMADVEQATVDVIVDEIGPA
ncbi:MAG TPA: Asp23/Gls24 family envelope stress response protein [Gaiellaceae bacterium]|nr:Asp23/Gls24 family envelope stress response protein [Gaiellaceae bacterium]